MHLYFLLQLNLTIDHIGSIVSVLVLKRKYPLLNTSVLNDCVCISLFPLRVRVHLHNIQPEAPQQIPSYSDPSNQLHYRVNNWHACTYCTVCFTSSFKNTMFVRICIFYRSMSQMEQYDNMTTWTVMMTLSVSYETKWWCVQRERLIPSSLFNLWTGLYWTTMYNQTGWKLSYCIQCIPFIMLQFCTYIFF